MMKTLIIVDINNPTQKFIDDKILDFSKRNNQINQDYYVLLYTDDPDNQLITKLKQKLKVGFKVIDFGTQMEIQSEKLKNEINKFSYNIGDGFSTIVKKTFNSQQASLYSKLWWYTEISLKNSPVDPTWWAILRFNISKHYLIKLKCDNCIYIGDNLQADLINQYCLKSNILLLQNIINNKSYYWRIILVRLLSGICYLGAIIITKLRFFKFQKNIYKPNKEMGLVYSWYPTSWIDRDENYQDRYYGKYLELLKNKFNYSPVYRVYTDNEYISPINYWKRLTSLKKRLKIKNGERIVENFLHIRDIIKNYLHIREIINFHKIIKSNNFIELFNYNGVNTFKIFLPRLMRSIFVWFPHLVSLEKATVRLTKVNNPKVVLLYCYEFSYGRAIINGSRTNSDIKIIGLQHGPITQMKFLYNGDKRELTNKEFYSSVPSPDFYVLDGKISKTILRNRGVDSKNIYISGPLRLDDVFKIANDSYKIERFNTDNTRILVAPGHNDTDFVVRLILRSIKNSNYKVIIKSHPKIEPEVIEQLIINNLDEEDLLKNNISIVRDGDIYENMQNCDIFVCSYSSTGVEAIAFGLPIILLQSNRTPDMSLFYKYKNDILSARSSKILRKHLDYLTTNEDFRNQYLNDLKKVLKDSFYQSNATKSKKLELLFSELNRTLKV